MVKAIVEILIAMVTFLAAFMCLLLGLLGLNKVIKDDFSVMERMIMLMISVSVLGLAVLFGWFGVMLCR